MLAELSAAIVAQDSRAEERHSTLLEALRIVRDDDVSARAALWAMRDSAEYERAFEEDEPLVTVILTTYYNWPLLGERSLPSVLAQTYEHWEAIVVGDAAPDDARRVVESFGDKRLRFVNLPYRGPYPKRFDQGYLVSGTTPWNTGLALSRGRWVASNSDDDSLRPNHIESLLAHARERRAEVSYGYIHQVEPDSPGTRLGEFPPSWGHWGTQSSLLHAGLRFMPMQPTDWLFGIPNDMSLLQRMLRIGVRFSMLEETVVDYYPSPLWSDRTSSGTF
jgi:glycosyltransferase involved in cell wall biosynthesis